MGSFNDCCTLAATTRPGQNPAGASVLRDMGLLEFAARGQYRLL